MISIGFYGATRTVTGSKYLVRVNKQAVLIDCGMFQGRRDIRQKNWQPLPFEPSDLNGIIITHAHIDHIGFVPRMTSGGYKGEIFATPPTVDLAKVLLRDSARIQEEDADYRNRKGLTRHKPALPLFTEEDAKAAIKQFKRVQFGKWRKICPGIKFRFHVAGHILGAASVELELNDGKKSRSILFSGDVGRYSIPLVVDPEPPPATDFLVCESTYGGEYHPPADPFYNLGKLLKKIVKNKQILLIPSFAVGRTQQITYMINVLIRQGVIPPISINVDSPMAVKATDIYCRHIKYHEINIEDLDGIKCVLNGENVTLHRKRKSSKLLNKLKGPAVIISASGMLTGGRILHHLINRLPDPNLVVALVGYMAEGTLGRRLADGDKTVFIHKRPIEVKAKIIKHTGLSGHADHQELNHWLDDNKLSPKRVFLTHGEYHRSRAMATDLKAKRGWNCVIPEMDQVIELE